MEHYPEHEKLKAIRDKSQCVGEFLEWLSEKGIELCSRHEHTDECKGDDGFNSCGFHGDEYWSISTSSEKLLAEFFEIDLKRLEDEKQAMIEVLRKTNAERDKE